MPVEMTMQYESAMRATSKNLIVVGLIFNGLCFSVVGYAQTNEPLEPPESLCVIAASVDNRQQAVYFTQQTFEDNVQELAIVALDERQTPVTKRVTYNQKQTQECHFPTIAITRAGQWGWFLAWTHEDKAYYARMDGEVLVFPPPKLLPLSQVTKIEFSANSPKPTMRLQTQNGASKILVSDDEGRSWYVTSP